MDTSHRDLPERQQGSREWDPGSSRNQSWDVGTPGGILVIKNSVLEVQSILPVCHRAEISPAQLTEEKGWVEHAGKTMGAGLWTSECSGLQNRINSKSCAAAARPCTHLTWMPAA